MTINDSNPRILTQWRQTYSEAKGGQKMVGTRLIPGVLPNHLALPCVCQNREEKNTYEIQENPDLPKRNQIFREKTFRFGK
jgi:hypothetical protein